MSLSNLFILFSKEREFSKMICYFPEWYNKLCAARNDGSLSISNCDVYNLLHVSISSTSNRPALNQ